MFFSVKKEMCNLYIPYIKHYSHNLLHKSLLLFYTLFSQLLLLFFFFVGSFTLWLFLYYFLFFKDTCNRLFFSLCIHYSAERMQYISFLYIILFFSFFLFFLYFSFIWILSHSTLHSDSCICIYREIYMDMKWWAKKKKRHEKEGRKSETFKETREKTADSINQLRSCLGFLVKWET